MHSKYECNHLLATHEAAVAVARTHYSNNVGCACCSCDCHHCGCNCGCNIDQAAATAATPTTATTATASTPTLHSNTSNTIMAYISGQYAHGMHYAVTTWGNVRYCYMQCLPLLPLHPTAHKVDANAAMVQELQFPQHVRVYLTAATEVLLD